MAVFQFKVDIFSEIERICNFNYRLYVYSRSLAELEKIVNDQKGKNRKAAKLALQLVKAKNIPMLKSVETYADDAILENADNDTIVATLDLDLKRKLLQRGISVIILRQKKYLQLIERKLYK